MPVPRSNCLLIGYILSSHYGQSGWGSTLLLRPELAGVTVATIEPRPGCNVVGSPYPHPSPALTLGLGLGL